MSREDICNVEPVTPEEFFEYVSPVTGLTEKLARLHNQPQPDPAPEEIAERCLEILAARRARGVFVPEADDECDSLDYDFDDRWELVEEGDE